MKTEKVENLNQNKQYTVGVACYATQNKRQPHVGAGPVSAQNAITLISLVVTVIILLILAGVTINLTLGNNGIFKTAEKAAKNYTNAQNKELAELSNFDNTLVGIIKDMEYDKLSSKAKPGDYVKYTPQAKAFSMIPEQTGQDTNQNFNTEDYIGLWQVLYNDEEHGLQIISADIVGNLILGNDTGEVKAKLAYNNSVDTLNNFCSNYVDTKYASSGRSVGSNPINPEDATANTVTLQFSYKGTSESGMKVGDTNYLIDYNAMKSATNQISTGICKLADNYWIATRAASSGKVDANFSVRRIVNGGVSGFMMWACSCYNDTVPGSLKSGVRPVIILKSEIETNFGDGSQTSPFELVAK